jgi:DNA-binding response OmpR family regulator
VSRVLLLTAENSDIIPALGLLPHTLITAPVSPQSIASNPDVDLILLDGVSDLVGAKSMATVLASAHLPIPVLLVVSETSLSVLDSSWGITDFLLPSATLAEIDARIRLAAALHPSASTGSGLSHSGVSIDESSYQATVTGRPLDLTFKEFELLRYLVANTGRVFTPEQLLSDVWGYDYFGGTRTVDVHVRRLRAKLGDHESVIGTVRNVGYRFAPTGVDDE